MTMSPERRARLVALGELHRKSAASLVESATFDADGERRGADYQQHYGDVDAAADAEDVFHKKARKIMGLDPATGERLTE